ncbi:ORF2b [Cape gooseberry ilarvirus 1]|uniref:ORF2b n=1 Tax=Cape gooseberry ilarvirus 1 TaxID=2116599 RepID=UPI000D20F663|nr:ORF2b [Cape gooseberry ilarvirus 1]AVN67119.1 ORF2b [Cape gooseberry ilarvirus 1]UEP18546.1 MAG: ORF2b [Cape gooseberry ilarvirus 1]UEP18551.1 MAG: ORF2b [Cape gooseberry ilarvirus 1]
MMSILILFLTLILGVQSELMSQNLNDVDQPQKQEIPKESPRVRLNPEESVTVVADSDAVAQFPHGSPMEERSPPGKVEANCIDCAIKSLPETLFSVKVPKLNINFEVSEFPSSRLLFTSLASRVKSLPFMKSFSVPNDFQRLQLKSIGEAEVHISIPKFGWNQILKLSDVITGFNVPKLPTIVPKLESCVGECVSTN